MIKKKIPAHTVEIRKYVCLGCGLGMECGNPGAVKKHLYVMGFGNQWMCGPVKEIPAFPKFIKVRNHIVDQEPGSWYLYSMDKNGDRLRLLKGSMDKPRAWENVEQMLAHREYVNNSGHECGTACSYPICSLKKRKK